MTTNFITTTAFLAVSISRVLLQITRLLPLTVLNRWVYRIAYVRSR
ncbi:unnamed protein product [Acidithrix sp. C25]|nr:unnamed protein product [Acidithrix sp. C25]